MLKAPNGSKRRNVAVDTSQTTAQQLAAIDRACRELAQCDSLPEVKNFRDQAEVLRKYAKSAKAGLELVNKAAEFKLRAERRAGQLLAEMELHGGDRVSATHHMRITLEQLDINQHQSARWQAEATVPEDTFNQFLQAARENDAEITTAALLRLARSLSKKPTTFDQPVRTVNQPNSQETASPSSSADQITAEILDHCATMKRILDTFLDSAEPVDVPLPSKRYVKRLLTDIPALVQQLNNLAMQQAAP